jgi:hypothetical protein
VVRVVDWSTYTGIRSERTAKPSFSSTSDCRVGSSRDFSQNSRMFFGSTMKARNSAARSLFLESLVATRALPPRSEDARTSFGW